MTVLNAFNVDMGFGESVLFENVSFQIGERDKVSLVGANGTGKTTLFKLIIGELEPVGGEVIKSKNVTLGYMEQHACADSDRTLYCEMESVFEPLIQMEKELENLADKIHGAQGDITRLIERQSFLHDEFERRDGLTFRSRTKSALTGLGFEARDFDLPCNDLSGGQRSKLCLGKLLLSGSDLLLLDEPTNHLDISSVEWLENFLNDYKGAAIIISHERYFLDKVTTKTLELSHHRLVQWNGNYSQYLKQKAVKKELDRRQYENKISEIEHIEGIIEQQRRWGRARNFVTAASKQKMLDKKLDDLDIPEGEEDKLSFSFKPAYVSGNEVLTVKDLAKSFGENHLFEGVNFKIMKDERAFLLGSNGCGKTTLLRILTREQRPEAGSFRLGSNVKVGYFDQALAGMNSAKTVLDEIWDCHREMNTTQVRSALAAFLFKGDDVFKIVNELSGGEKARVALLKLMLSGANFLLLDEPTNHLDITSMEALEQALLNFEGTMLIVSHDRYFINKLATQIFSLDKTGSKEYIGGYDYYLEALEREKQEMHSDEKQQPKTDGYKLRREHASEQRKLAGKIKRSEQAIDEIDEKIAQLNAELSLPETANDYEKLIALTAQIEQLHQEQEKMMIEWERLEQELSDIQPTDMS